MNLNKRIHWNIAGAFAKYNLIIDFFSKRNLYNKYRHITVYDGIENCTWNGGRLHKYIPYNKKIKEHYYDLGWSINLTFSNTKINLNDEKGNYLLKEFHKEGNGIILVNDDLRKYINKNYPKYKLIHSITACGDIQGFPLREEDLIFYKDKLKKYDMIIPRCDSTFDKKLRILDKEKIEILISDTCILNCPHFGKHFKDIAKHNEKEINATADLWTKVGECWIESQEFKKKVAFEKRMLGDKYPFYLSYKQIQSLIREGYTTFKIQGREASEKDFLFDLNRFLRDYNEK